VAILATLGITVYSSSQKTARAAKRKGDLKDIVNALEIYKIKNGRYPDVTSSTGRGGWGDSDLNPTNYVIGISGSFKFGIVPVDPVNNATYHYSYYRYPAAYTGCTGVFYVVGILKFESMKKNPVGWKCPGRDWTLEFDEVAGAYE